MPSPECQLWAGQDSRAERPACRKPGPQGSGRAAGKGRVAVETVVIGRIPEGEAVGKEQGAGGSGVHNRLIPAVQFRRLPDTGGVLPAAFLVLGVNGAQSVRNGAATDMKPKGGTSAGAAPGGGVKLLRKPLTGMDLAADGAMLPGAAVICFGGDKAKGKKQGQDQQRRAADSGKGPLCLPDSRICGSALPPPAGRGSDRPRSG